MFISSCHAGGYGGASSGSYGGGSATGGGAVGPVSGFGGGPVTAAVQSSHTVEIRHVNVPMELPQPQIVEVEAGNLPLTIHFKSASSALNVVQTHQPGLAGEAQHTTSEDEPHRLVHEVTKPVIQEVREIITPYRRVIQEIKPVQEEIQTIIAKGEPRPNPQDAFANQVGSVGSLGGLGSGLKGGHYASASNTNPQAASLAGLQRTPSSNSKSTAPAAGAVSYFNDQLSGISFAQTSPSLSPQAQTSSSSTSSSAKTSSAQSNGAGSIRILEGGNSRSSGLSSINAY